MHKVTKVIVPDGLKFEDVLAELYDSLMADDHVILNSLVINNQLYVVSAPDNDVEVF